jgi:hypothetical protein
MVDLKNVRTVVHISLGSTINGERVVVLELQGDGDTEALISRHQAPYVLMREDDFDPR